MRFSIIKAIVQKELLDLIRDRRALISMFFIPLVVFPLLVRAGSTLIPRLQDQATTEARARTIPVRVETPAVLKALESLDFKLDTAPIGDLKAMVESQKASAAVEEVAGSPPEIRIYADFSNPGSSATAAQIQTSLIGLREQTIRETLRGKGVDVGVLNPFKIDRENAAGQRKMAGSVWGTVLGYMLMLMMFSGGMYPVMDMSVGEKERKTIEALLVSPAGRGEIVTGKILTAVISILTTSILTTGGMIFSFRSINVSSQDPGGARLREMLGTIPLDSQSLLMLAATLLPLACFAASLMFALGVFARSFKEAQTYLAPLLMFVIFPAIAGGLPGFKMTPILSLIPIFNASQIIRGILVGDVTTVNFAVTTLANLAYAAMAFLFAKTLFERETVLFRT
ncbi:MAG: ABC transporter permease subunit [Acidobacteriota bacterium]